MPSISGIVYDIATTPVAGRTVRAYRRDTGALLGTGVSELANQTSDPYFRDVAVLLNGATLTDSSPTPLGLTAVGTAAISLAQSKFGVSSLYLSGVGAGVNVAYSKRSTVLGGNFTIEAWVYCLNAAKTSNQIYDARQSGGTGTAWVFQINATGKLDFYNAGSNISTGSVASNVWTHVAVVRVGTTVTFFIDGVASGTVTVSGAITGGASSASSIGGKDVDAYKFGGYINDFRLTNGVARYTANFTPSATAVPAVGSSNDASFASVALLLKGDGSQDGTTFTDSSGTPKTMTLGGTVFTDTTQAKFGNGSVYIDGSSDFLSLSNAALVVGTGDFTLEAWVYHTNSSTFACYFDTRSADNSTTGFYLARNSSNAIYLYTTATLGTGGAVVANQWMHVALCRTAGTLRVFLDGAVIISVANSSNATSQVIKIGDHLASGSASFKGHMDDIRYTVGIGRYAGPFIPPYRAHSVIVGDETAYNGTLGSYLINTTYTGEVQVVALDDAAGTTYNDLILRTTPV